MVMGGTWRIPVLMDLLDKNFIRDLKWTVHSMNLPLNVNMNQSGLVLLRMLSLMQNNLIIIEF